MRSLFTFLFFFLSLSLHAEELAGPCAKTALRHAMKGRRGAKKEFALKLPQNGNPEELHHYEIGFSGKDGLYHGEVSVEFIKGKCASPKLQYVSMLE